MSAASGGDGMSMTGAVDHCRVAFERWVLVERICDVGDLDVDYSLEGRPYVEEVIDGMWLTFKAGWDGRFKYGWGMD